MSTVIEKKREGFKLLLERKKHILIVSLPENKLEFAQAAVEGGADAIKLHLNVVHRATGRMFPSWSEEKRNIERICELDICVGVVPGGRNHFATERDLVEMQEVGICFIDFFVDYAPSYVMKVELARMFGLNDFSQICCIQAAQDLKPDALELSIVPEERYGERLTVGDLLRYSKAVNSSSVPCFVPSEKKIEPSEVLSILSCGVKGIIIGPIVTGTSLKEFSQAVRVFRRCMDSF